MGVQLVCFLAFVCALHAVNSYHVHPWNPTRDSPSDGRTGITVQPENPYFGQKLLCRNEKESCFRYERSSDIGPYCWFAIDHDCNRCCSPHGRFQSPISIPHISHPKHIHRKLEYDWNHFVGKLENNGLYPKFVPQKENSSNLDKPYLSGLTRDTYVFDNIHIHFGAWGDSRQTEHVVEDDGHYIAEVHLVHHRIDFNSVVEAKDQRNGIAVIGIFLSVDAGSRNAALDAILRRLREVKKFTREEPNPCTVENENIEKGVVDAADSHSYKCQNVITLSKTRKNENKKCLLLSHGAGCGEPAEKIIINPNDLLDYDRTYYHYQGGLTTPPCSESVLWYVQKEPVKVDWSVINDLADMESRISNKYISDVGNLRPLQSKGHRRISLLEFE